MFTFTSLAEQFASRFLNHWLQPCLEKEMTVGFEFRSSVLCAVLTDLEFSPVKINELLSKFSLPFVVNDVRIDELVLEMHFTTTSCKVGIIVNGLKSTIIPLQPSSYCNVLDSMIDSFYGHQQNVPLDEILKQLSADSDRYKEITAQETSKKLLLSLNDIIDITLENSAVRVELCPDYSSSGISLELRIHRIRIFSGPAHGVVPQTDSKESQGASSLSCDSVLSRCVAIEGVSLYTEEMTRSFPEFSFNSCESEQNSASTFTESQWKSHSCHRDDSTPVKFASVPGEILIKIAFEERANKSSVKISGSIPDIGLFFTPRQLFTLTELVNEVSKKTPLNSTKLESVPLTSEDYHMLERQQAVGATAAEQSCIHHAEFDTLSFGQLPSAASATGWSTPKYDCDGGTSTNFDGDYNSHFGESYTGGSSYKPYYAQSVTSDIPSVVTESGITYRTQRGSTYAKSEMTRSRDWMKDPVNHVVETKVDLQIHSVCALILHEDVIVPGGIATYKELEAAALNFFNILEIHTEAALATDIKGMRHIISKECQENHFQFVATRISMDAVHMQRNEQVQLLAVFRVHNMEFVECVSEKGFQSFDCFVDLLTFKNDGLLAKGNPCLNVSYETSSEIRNTYRGVIDTGNSRSEVSLALANCATEIDLSLIDRADAFFKCPSFFDHGFCATSVMYDTQTDPVKSEAVVFKHDLKVTCSCASIDVRLRFPVPDLRPISALLTKEIWKRDVRNDILTIRLNELSFCTSFCLPVEDFLNQIKILCTNLEVLFQECASSEQHRLAQVVVSDDSSPISLLLDFSSKRSKAKVQPHSGRTSYGNPLPRPFYEKKLVSCHKEAVSDPLLYPADEPTFANFILRACTDAELNVTAELPSVHIVLPLKHVYEVLYNRLAYDLLLWQPHSSQSTNHTQPQIPVRVIDTLLGDSMTTSIYHSFSCDGEGEDDPVKKVSANPVLARTTLGLVLRIEQGTIDVRTPCLDLNGERDVDAKGRILLDMKDASVYVAAAYNGDKNKSYVGVFSKDIALAHHPRWSNEVHENNFDKMYTIINRCSAESMGSINFPSSDAGMLSLVMDFDFDEVRNVNTMILSGKLDLASYTYCMTPAHEMWMVQLQDMFAVQDYPINGYEVPEVVNDIHFSFGNCLVRYKPESFNSEALLHVGSLILASSLSYTCNVSIFRMIVEDSSLYIRNVMKTSALPVTAQVLKSGVLQLTVRQSLRKINNIPDLEIIVVGALVTLMTCTDSLAELLRFVSHFTEVEAAGNSDGMHDTDFQSTVVKASSEPTDDSEADARELQQRCALLAEAIEELPGHAASETSEQVAGQPLSFSPFAFPDESSSGDQKDALVEVYKPQYDDKCTVLDIFHEADHSRPYEIALFTNNPWPETKQAMPKPLYGVGSSAPVIRWHIKELSVCWQLCQGQAFSSPSDTELPSRWEESTSLGSPSLVIYSARESSLSFQKSSPSIGRKDRIKMRATRYKPMVEINIKKLRYCFECFPPDSTVSCYHNIAVRDAEILDLVPASNLQKLLCRYVTEEYPIGEKSDFLSINLTVRRRPNELQCEECDLDISLGNIRMYVDQATVAFLMEFYTEMSGLTAQKPGGVNAAADTAVAVVAATHAVAPHTAAAAHAVAAAAAPVVATARREPRAHTASPPNARAPFFKSIVFNPAVVIVIDFEGNFADIGSLHELILALSSANKITIKLKEINFKRGILGLDKVAEFLRKEWVDDIYANQKFGLVKMIAPIGLLVEIVGGLWEFVEAPFQQYMKDGNIFRGLVLGSRAFTCRSMAATFGLLGKFFNFLEIIASFLMVVVTNNHKVEGARAPPPDAVMGVCVATHLVRSRMARITSNVIESTLTERRERGVAGALSGFTRHIPEMVLTPPFLATQVTGCILTGLQHQWTPGNEKELQQKYK